MLPPVSERLILSLCDVTGNWPRPYALAGYPVRTVELENGEDVRLMKRPDGPVWGILAAPPCTVFSRAGNRWPRSDDDMREALSVVDACLRLVVACRPRWWALENPAGTLRQYLGRPRWYFDPCDFGDPWTKRTALWGEFTPPVAGGLLTTTRPCEPTRGSAIHLMPGVSPRDSAAVARRKRTNRSATPPGFALAFFESNP